MKKRVVIGGSRYFQNYPLFCNVVGKYLSKIQTMYEIVIVSGHCRGTDFLAEKYAKEYGFDLEIFPADWSLGKKAGPLRNEKMVAVADYVIAFDSGGQGTRSLINCARKKGIPLRIQKIDDRSNNF